MPKKKSKSAPVPALPDVQPSAAAAPPAFKPRRSKPRRSLRTILLIWFLLLSLVPLMFVTGYSLVKYEQAIDMELVQRLRSTSREFSTNMQEFETFLTNRGSKHKADSLLASYLLAGANAQLREHLQSLVRSSPVSVTLNAFNSGAELVASYSKDETGNARQNLDVENANLAVSDALVENLEKRGLITYTDIARGGTSLDLIALTRIESKNGRKAGYLEEILNIGPTFLEGLKKRLNLEVMLLDSKGQLIASSQPDFKLYPKGYFAKTVLDQPETFFDLPIREEPFGFITTQVKWGDSQFIVGLGASKQRSRAFVKNVNYAFFTMVGAIGLLLVVVSVFATRAIVQPVYELVEAIQTMDSRDGPSEIVVSSDTELGVLQASFNEMSQRIFQTKSELETKVREVEAAYAELKATQARLVHTAKMASLGQLVAGIAHELNNPIGFIYSNMSHMKDYSERLVSIIEAAEKGPSKLAAAKEEADFAYIVRDLPRLISSCEEGARRTRDIVLGLRNFSRLDEAKLKKVSLKEGIETTLRLLSGELKNRVRVHEDYQSAPEVMCYASQINQVFMNILTNAAQAIDGEGDIWIALSALGSDRVQISIRDSGKGMSGEVLDKIFDPFFTTKNPGQGTGLGLSISYGIVKQHGGDIQVRSETGKGTEFQISLPIEGLSRT